MKTRTNLKKYIAILLTMMLVGCGTNETVVNEQAAAPLQQNPIVTMNIADYGTVTLELYPDKAPNTVNNFVKLVNEGFYDGLTFHRIVEGFMIQGGDPQGTGVGGPGYAIAGEFESNGYANDLMHTKGVISMARSMDKNSAGSQFFIMAADSPSLDGQYAAFGQVIEGIEIIEQLDKVPVNGETPVDTVVIESVTVDTNGETPIDVVVYTP